MTCLSNLNIICTFTFISLTDDFVQTSFQFADENLKYCINASLYREVREKWNVLTFRIVYRLLSIICF